jgi:hypothetical protein
MQRIPTSKNLGFRSGTIYGLKTSIGYVSFAGALATIQPLLQLADWLFR